MIDIQWVVLVKEEVIYQPVAIFKYEHHARKWAYEEYGECAIVERIWD